MKLVNLRAVFQKHTLFFLHGQKPAGEGHCLFAVFHFLLRCDKCHHDAFIQSAAG